MLWGVPCSHIPRIPRAPLPPGQHSWAAGDTLAPRCQVDAAPLLSWGRPSIQLQLLTPWAPPPPAHRPVTGETQTDSSSGLLLPAQLTQYFMRLLLNVVPGGGSEPLSVRSKEAPREGACHAREGKGCTPSQRHIFGGGGPPGRGCL